MSLDMITVLSSPKLLYTTSITSFIIARLIIYHVGKNGAIPFASTLMKYNNIFYSQASLLLCLAIARSFWTEISQPNLTLEAIICSRTTLPYDLTLRYIYHASKIYEYIDIFNVLAVGGDISVHFGIHHFTMPYLTYSREILHPTGWKIFALLNTLHHAIMYAYFGGAAVVRKALPVTGALQLVVGIAVEEYIVRTDCAAEEGWPWAYLLAGRLMTVYAVLFAGELWERSKEKEARKGAQKEAQKGS